MAAVIADRRDAGGGLVLVTLDVDAAHAAAYTSPGQYVEVTTAQGDGYFVLAGDPGEDRWELLVRNAGDASEVLVSADLGAAVDVSMPLGHGFPVDRARGGPLVVAVAGSAFAVARPVLRRRIAQGDARATHLLLGVPSASEVPLEAEVEGWTRAGASVVLCLSRGELEHRSDALPAALRASGYAQDELARAVHQGRIPRGAMAVVAGPPAMLDEIRELGRGALEVVTNL